MSLIEDHQAVQDEEAKLVIEEWKEEVGQTTASIVLESHPRVTSWNEILV